MSDKVTLQKRTKELEHRISQLRQFGYEEEVLLKQKDLDELKRILNEIEIRNFEEAQRELVELLKKQKRKKKRAQRSKKEKDKEE